MHGSHWIALFRLGEFSFLFLGTPLVLNDVQRLELFWVGLVEITTTSLGAFTCSLCVITLRNVDIYDDDGLKEKSLRQIG